QIFAVSNSIFGPSAGKAYGCVSLGCNITGAGAVAYRSGHTTRRMVRPCGPCTYRRIRSPHTTFGEADMATIIAGRFAQQEEVQHAIAALQQAGAPAAQITSFYVNPQGQHDLYPVGGDRDESPG